MYPEWGWLLVLAVFIWLGVLTYLVWRQGGFLKSLFPKGSERDIRKKFEEIISQVFEFRQDLSKLNNKVGEVEKAGLKHVQRVQLLRFNPYDDTGGDQSFSLSLLDNKGNGVVITSLHARSGTRVFAKDVVLGRGSKHKFSEEEVEVVRKTMERQEHPIDVQDVKDRK